MSKFRTALTLMIAAALAAPLSLSAQTETPQTDTAPAQTEMPEASGTETPDATGAEAPSTGALIEDQLSLGEDATQANQPGQPYTRETIGAWEMRCIRTEDAPEPCQMYQLMMDQNDNPVAEASIFRLPEGGRAVAGATVVVPLETALQSQLRVSIDGSEARRYPYAFCNPIGCYVRLGLTAEDVAAFKRGNEAVLTIVPALAPDQTVALQLSLSGFTASYEKVSVIEQ